MSLLDLGLLYALVGLSCAVAIYRAERAAAAAGSGATARSAAWAAALAVPLWPLWAPVALGRRAPAAPAAPAATGRASAHARGPARDAAKAAGRGAAMAEATAGASESAVAATAARIEAALAECVEACAGTPVAALLPGEAAGRIAAEVGRAAARHAELTALLGREGFDLGEAERRLAALTRDQGSARAVATARLHLENVRRLSALRDRDAQALEELSDLVQALRAQLHLARYAGASGAALGGAGMGAGLEGTSGIVSEVWARVEGLSAVLEPQEELAPEPAGVSAIPA